jgi:hypothetical protein
MILRPTIDECRQERMQLSERLRTVRLERYGSVALAQLTREIGVGLNTWLGFEDGARMPANILLHFVELTRVEPLWLLHGLGPKYQLASSRGALAGPLRLFDAAGPDTAAPSDAESTEADPDSPSTLTMFSSASGGRRPEDPVEQAPFRWEDSAGEASKPFGPFIFDSPREWQPAPKGDNFMMIEGADMAPLLVDGAYVGYAAKVEPFEALEGSLVVAQVDGQYMVRWLHQAGSLVELNAHDPFAVPRTLVIDPAIDSDACKIRRVLWISNPR